MARARELQEILPDPVVIDGRPISIDDVIAVARGRRPVQLGEDAIWRDSIEAAARFLDEAWRDDGVIYGVTTGYGGSCDVSVPPALVAELPLHLTRFHGCGMGRYLDPDSSAAVLMVRLASLSRGLSGVRLVLLERLATYINRRILPVVPEEGSVGASGDLTPLSYVAATLTGEREVYRDGKPRPAGEVLEEEALEPLSLQPKEALAIMNGTSVMTALACMAFERADYLTRLGSRITALAARALKGNRGHFDARIFAAKPYPGQQRIAGWIRQDLAGEVPKTGPQLQDRYSIRCAPHIIGVLADALIWMRTWIETEINSANDNPLIDAAAGAVMHGGNFYGGHIAFAMDGMKNAVANCADMLDRQMLLMLDPTTNNGLPSNLSGAIGDRRCINHGFKAVQIAASAWAAEALKLTMPASVFSRSTENHNQDKVSMGTIAARDCLRVLELTEQTAAAGLLAAVQAIQLRERTGDSARGDLSDSQSEMIDLIVDICPLLDEDRPLDTALRRIVAGIRRQEWSLYD